MSAIRAAFIALAATLSTAAGAQALTLTFESVPDGGPGCPPNPSSIEISGFTVGNCPGFYGSPGTIHLDDSGTSFPSFVTFSAPLPFDAAAIEIEGLGSDFIDVDAPVPYGNVLAQGFRGGSPVAERVFHATGPGIASYGLGAGFAALDLLRVEQILPGPVDQAAYPDAACVDAPCGHVNLLSVTVAPVPLPSALLLLTGSLASLAGWRLRPRGLG